MSLPKFLQPYFWDVDFNKLNFKKYPHFILERILEYGDKRVLNWMNKQYPKKLIKETVISSRFLSPRSANFWALMLGIDTNKVLCLKKSSRKRQSRIWPN